MLYGPSTAAVYVTTGALMRFAVGPVQTILGSGNAGIGYLAGKKEWKRIHALRLQMHEVALLLMTTVALLTFCFNKAFLSLWIGEKYYGGDLLSATIISSFFVRQFVYLDGIYLDAVLRLNIKTYINFVGAMVSLFVAFLLLNRYPIAAFPMGLTAGYMMILLLFQLDIRRNLQMGIRSYIRQLARPAIVASGCIAGVFAFRNTLSQQPTGWLLLIVQGTALGLAVLAACFILGASGTTRSAMLNRFRVFTRDVWAGH